MLYLWIDINTYKWKETKFNEIISFALSCSVVSDSLQMPGFSVYGIFQARILEWVAMPSSRGSSQSRNQTQVSHIAGRFFTIWATRDAIWNYFKNIVWDLLMVVKWSGKGLLEPPGSLMIITANLHLPCNDHYTWVLKIKIIPEKGE